MSAQRYQPDRIGFFTALLGLVIAPGETVRQLLSGDRPRYAFSLLVILFLAVFVPIFIQWHYYGRNLYQPEALALLFLMLLLTLLIFVVIEFLLLMLMGVRCSIRDLMGIVCYCLSPIILGILAMYAINYAASGSLTFVTFVLNGTAA